MQLRYTGLGYGAGNYGLRRRYGGLSGALSGPWPLDVPVGPPTRRVPEGERYWVCDDFQLDPRFTGGVTSGRVCIPMYGGEQYGKGHPEVLGAFKALQRAINDYIEAHDLPIDELVVDGQIGPVTTDAYRQLSAGFADASLAADNADDLALLAWQTWSEGAGSLAGRLAAAAGTVVNPSNDRLPTDNRPTRPVVVNPPAPAPDTMPATPPEQGQRRTNALWYALLGVSALGAGALAVSMVRERRRESALAPSFAPARR